MNNVLDELFYQSIESLDKEETSLFEELEDELANYEADDPKYTTLLEIEMKCFRLGLKAGAKLNSKLSRDQLEGLKVRF